MKKFKEWLGEKDVIAEKDWKKDEAFQSKHWILNKLNQQHAAGVQSVKQAIEQIKQITNQVDPEGMNGFAYKEWQNFLSALSRIESVIVAAGDNY